MFDPINLENELAKEREKRYAQAILLFEAEKLLYDAASRDKAIWERINSEKPSIPVNIPIEELDHQRIFSEEDIRKICAKYRLRFLDSHLFKGEIPYEAVQKIRAEEQQAGTSFGNFKVVAPSTLFRLQDNTKDPLLFADLGNGQYYLIHKWGKDLSWYRGLMLFPLRNIGTLAVTTMLLALLLTAFMPQEWIPENYLRTTALTYFFKAFCFFIVNSLLFTVLLISGIIATKDFSENVWNSKFFN